MSALPTPEKYISVSKSGIILGKKVAAFFKNRKALFVNIILNYNNKSLIIMDTGITQDVEMNNFVEQGLRITYERNYKHNTDIKLRRLISFLDIDCLTKFKARPLTRNSVVVENIPLKDSISLRGHIVEVNMKNKLIVFGNLNQCAKIKLEDITPSQLITKTIEKNSITTINTHPPLQIKPQPLQKKITQPTLDRDNVDNDLLEMPAENLPSQEEIESVNREYSKMILGE